MYENGFVIGIYVFEEPQAKCNKLLNKTSLMWLMSF